MQAPEEGLLAPDLVLYLDISPEVGCYQSWDCFNFFALLVDYLFISGTSIEMKIYLIQGMFGYQLIIERELKLISMPYVVVDLNVQSLQRKLVLECSYQ